MDHPIVSTSFPNNQIQIQHCITSPQPANYSQIISTTNELPTYQDYPQATALPVPTQVTGEVYYQRGKVKIPVIKKDIIQVPVIRHEMMEVPIVQKAQVATSTLSNFYNTGACSQLHTSQTYDPEITETSGLNREMSRYTIHTEVLPYGIQDRLISTHIVEGHITGPSQVQQTYQTQELQTQTVQYQAQQMPVQTQVFQQNVQNIEQQIPEHDLTNSYTVARYTIPIKTECIEGQQNYNMGQDLQYTSMAQQGQYTLEQQGQCLANQGQYTAEQLQGQVLANQGQYAAVQGQGLANQGQYTAEQGQYLANQGQYAVQQGQCLPNQGQLTPEQLQGQGLANQGQLTPEQLQGKEFQNRQFTLGTTGECPSEPPYRPGEGETGYEGGQCTGPVPQADDDDEERQRLQEEALKHKEEAEAIKEKYCELENEQERLRKENEEKDQEAEKLKGENDDLKNKNDKLMSELEQQKLQQKKYEEDLKNQEELRRQMQENQNLFAMKEREYQERERQKELLFQKEKEIMEQKEKEMIKLREIELAQHKRTQEENEAKARELEKLKQDKEKVEKELEESLLIQQRQKEEKEKITETKQIYLLQNAVPPCQTLSPITYVRTAVPMSYQEIIKGDIIHGKQELDFLAKRLNKANRTIYFNLLYKATVDGDSAAVFHSKCDEANGSLVLVETPNGKRFGGYTTQSWAGDKLDKVDDEAFVFSLNKMAVYDVIKGENAVGCYPKFGPVFFGCQIRIFDNFFVKGGTTFSKGLNYNTDEDFVLTGGDQKFDVKELEVYEVKFS